MKNMEDGKNDDPLRWSEGEIMFLIRQEPELRSILHFRLAPSYSGEDIVQEPAEDDSNTEKVEPVSHVGRR